MSHVARATLNIPQENYASFLNAHSPEKGKSTLFEFGFSEPTLHWYKPTAFGDFVKFYACNPIITTKYHMMTQLIFLGNIIFGLQNNY